MPIFTHTHTHTHTHVHGCTCHTHIYIYLAGVGPGDCYILYHHLENLCESQNTHFRENTIWFGWQRIIFDASCFRDRWSIVDASLFWAVTNNRWSTIDYWASCMLRLCIVDCWCMAVSLIDSATTIVIHRWFSKRGGAPGAGSHCVRGRVSLGACG